MLLNKFALLLTGLVLSCVYSYPYTIVVPQVVHGPHWQTTLRILNAHNYDVEIQGTLSRSDGTPWTTVRFLRRLGGWRETDATGAIVFGVNVDLVEEYVTSTTSGSADSGDADFAGYLTLQIDDGARGRVSVTAFLTYYPQANSPHSQVGLFPSGACTHLSFPFDSETAIAVVNPADDPVTIYAMLVQKPPDSDDAPAKQIYHASLSLKGHEQKALFVRELFTLKQIPDSEYFGRAILFTQNFSRSFAALPLIFRTSGLMTSIPALVLGEQ